MQGCSYVGQTWNIKWQETEDIPWNMPKFQSSCIFVDILQSTNTITASKKYIILQVNKWSQTYTQVYGFLFLCWLYECWNLTLKNSYYTWDSEARFGLHK